MNNSDIPAQQPTVFALEHYGLLTAVGTDAESFLQGQLTCDVKTLENHSLLGAHCNTKGRIRALYRLFKPNNRRDCFYLRLPKSMATLAIQHLNTYARFSKVALSETTSAVLSFGLMLTSAQDTPTDFPCPLPQQVNDCVWVGPHAIARVPDLYATHRFEVHLHLDPSQAHTSQSDALKQFLLATNPEPYAAWLLSDVLAGIPEVWPETSETLLPHYIGLPQLGAVSFSKGCYLGQEIIARMEYQSRQIKYHLALGKIDAQDAASLMEHPLKLPKPGESLNDQAGTIVSVAATSPKKDVYLLIQTPIANDARTEATWSPQNIRVSLLGSEFRD